jgi:hypothetical protein
MRLLVKQDTEKLQFFLVFILFKVFSIHSYCDVFHLLIHNLYYNVTAQPKKNFLFFAKLEDID